MESLDSTELIALILGAVLTKLVQAVTKRFGIKLFVDVKSVTKP